MSLDGRIRQGLIGAADSVQPNVEGDLMKVQSRSRNRRRMQWAAGVVAVAAIGAFFFLGGTDLFDSTGDTDPIPPAATGGAEPTVEPTPDSTPSDLGPSTPLEIWLTKGETLYPSARALFGGSSSAVGRDSVELLLKGVSVSEQVMDINTLIPFGTELRSLDISGGTATVDLTSEFVSGGGSLSMRMRIAQVVYTLTQFDTVQGVLFKIDGEPVESIGGEGVMVDTPQTRKDYEDLLPVIAVTTPGIGWDFASGDTIEGIANVFEANVSWRILDQNGEEIASDFTTATCGTGCWGDFTIEAVFSVDQDQPGTIEVFESSAKNGKPINVVSIPVTLLAK